MKELIRHILKEENGFKKDKLNNLVQQNGIVFASNLVGGFLNLVKILNIDVENIDEQEKLIKSYIYFADVEDIEVDFIEIKNIYNRKLIKIYFGTDSSASNIGSWYSRTITDEMNNFFPFKVDVVWHPVNYPHAKIMIDATHGGSVDFPNEINETEGKKLPSFFTRRVDHHKFEKMMRKGIPYIFHDSSSLQEFKYKLVEATLENYIHYKYDINIDELPQEDKDTFIQYMIDTYDPVLTAYYRNYYKR